MAQMQTNLPVLAGLGRMLKQGGGKPAARTAAPRPAAPTTTEEESHSLPQRPSTTGMYVAEIEPSEFMLEWRHWVAHEAMMNGKLNNETSPLVDRRLPNFERRLPHFDRRTTNRDRRKTDSPERRGRPVWTDAVFLVPGE